MPGERFSALYMRSEDRVPDSDKARHRVGALFGETVFNGRTELLARYVGQELGVAVPGDGRYSSYWHQFIRECGTPDFLDTVTLVYRYLYWHVGDGVANWWRDAVRHIFAEQNLAYEIDDSGGVHPAVDREFQRNRVSAVAALQPHRYQNIRDLLESASSHLGAEPPNCKLAWRATFSAVEGLFGLMFPYVRLTADEIDRRLRPVVTGMYEGDETAQQAAQRILASFKEWVEASRNYIHKPGDAEPAQPPADLAVLATSHGAALLRWLAGLEQDRSRISSGDPSRS
jgi:hypothetical protein